MNKKICDRCGAEIVKKKRTFGDTINELVGNLKVNFGAEHRVRYRIEIIDLNDTIIPYPRADLCEQCEKDLVAFMNNKKDAEDDKKVNTCT